MTTPDYDAALILSEAKINALMESIAIAYAHGRGERMDESLYKALEAWRTAANAWDRAVGLRDAS